MLNNAPEPYPSTVPFIAFVPAITEKTPSGVILRIKVSLSPIYRFPRGSKQIPLK